MSIEIMPEDSEFLFQISRCPPDDAVCAEVARFAIVLCGSRLLFRPQYVAFEFIRFLRKAWLPQMQHVELLRELVQVIRIQAEKCRCGLGVAVGHDVSAADRSAFRPLEFGVVIEEMSETTLSKKEARRLIDELPEDATWSDFSWLVIERQRIEEGIADLDAGITWTSDQIRHKLGIPR